MFMSILNRDAEHLVNEIAYAISWSAVAEQAAHPAGQTQAGWLPDADLRFALSGSALCGAGVLACDRITGITGPAFLRVDEVCFPVGAVAHRHTHAGAGLRHLLRGALRIEGTAHTQIMTKGDSWFEPANTPVRAVALQDEGVTSFVRCMVVPPDYEGRSTFTLGNAADEAHPRLQLTHRHIDHPIYVEAG